MAVPPERLDELEIPLMIENNTEKHRTAYTHTVDYKPGEAERLYLRLRSSLLI